MAYCQARLRGDPVPGTAEAIKPAAQSKKINGRNTVTPATSLIRLRTMKGKASASGREILNQEEDGGSGDEQSAAGSAAGPQGAERIAFDYNSSMSEDSASDAGTDQSF